MADKRCDNGHFIDESWDLCPYCPAESVDQELPIVRPTRAVPPPEPVRASVAAAAPQPTPAPPVVPRRDAPSGPVQAPPKERTIAIQKLDTASASKRYVVGWLIGLNGATRGESYPVRMGRNVLGRDRRSDIVVNDDQASSHHADLVFRPEERRFILMDHNSTNGTYVNDQKIDKRFLKDGDIIYFGGRNAIAVAYHA